MAVVLTLCVTGCERTPERSAGRPQWILVGIDGGDWEVVQTLMAAGRLPTFARLAERGSSARLGTEYGPSPVIWTTIATGAVPDVHGISDFVVATESGDVPVSSRVRRVPALWNMLTMARLRVAVLGWWASWPAEEVSGIVISDREGLQVDQRHSPSELAPRIEAWRRETGDLPLLFPGDEHPQRRDHLVARAAPELVREGFDLVMVYFRTVDLASHRYWKYWQPGDFEDVPAADVARYREIIPSTYEQVDAALSDILAASGERTNVLVVSDHGFESMDREKVRIVLNFDRALQHLGYLERSDDTVDWSRSTLYTFSTPRYRREKKIRYALRGREPGGTVEEQRREELREQLERDLQRVTYAGGEPAFRVRNASPRERSEGADFMVVVSSRNPTDELHYGDQVWTDVIASTNVISGNHDRTTHGIVFAAGPDLAAGADLAGMTIHDVAPTVLYGLGLPVAEDFAGRPWLPMFEQPFRTAQAVRTVPTWGQAADGEVVQSEADEQLVEELRALGYLN